MDRRLEYQDLDSITPAPNNPKEHQIDNVRASIDRFGYVAPMIVDDRTGRLVVGHGRLESLKARRDAGETPPEGVRTDETGRWLVPIIHGWSSRSDADAAAYLILDNRQSELGGWDHQALADLLDEIGDPDLIELTGWDPADLEELLNQVEELPPPSHAGDDVPPPRADPISTIGDLWILGEHRVLCGDATNPEHLDRLLDGMEQPGIVYMDPPYGINAVPKDGGASRGGAFGGKKNAKPDGSNIIHANTYLPIVGDGSPEIAADAFRLINTSYPTAKQVWWGGNHYAASANLPDATCWLVWDKENGNTNFADAELAWTNHHGAVRLLRHMWNGMLRASEREKRVHPTQKPVALAIWAFEQIDPKAELRVVLDAFGGSGSTLIAAHHTGRIAAICEISPDYVDVICHRYQQTTGTIPARLLADGSTEPHDFLKGNE